MVHWWRYLRLRTWWKGAKAQKDSRLPRADADLIRSIAEQNACVLRQRYDDQRTLAAACRRDKKTTVEDAASAL